MIKQRSSRRMMFDFDVAGFVAYLKEKRSWPESWIVLSLRDIERDSGSSIETIRSLIKRAVEMKFIEYESNPISRFRILRWF